MTYLPVDGSLIDPLVSRFMKGVFKSRPSCSRCLAAWNVSVVLSYNSLSAKEDFSLKESTFKLTMLMASRCVSPEQSDTLYELDFQFRVFKHDDMTFTVP